jgi:hypothetical protein
VTKLQRSLAACGALLFFIGLLTGVWVGAVMTQGRAIFLELHFTPQSERLALVAHLNALLGSFWLVAVAATIEATHYGEAGKRRLAFAVMGTCYANWSVTLLASFLDRKGLEIVKEDPRNNLVAVLLIALVVLPGLAASGAWAWGLMSAKGEA